MYSIDLLIQICCFSNEIENDKNNSKLNKREANG